MSRVPFTQKRALEILGVEVGASRDERTRMFDEKRALLEEKIQQAATSGLKARYQDALNDLTRAYEALELDATEWDLESLEGAPSAGTATEGGHQKSVPGLSGLSPWAMEKVRLSRRFLIPGAVVAALVVVLAFGWTWKKRSDAERIANEATARIEREKAVARASQEREAQARAHEQARLAEQKVALEKKAREQLAAEKARLQEVQPYLEEVSESVKKQRAAAHSLGSDSGWRKEWTRRRLALLEAYEKWLKAFAAQHPARAHLQAAERLFQSGNPDGALAEIQVAASQGEKLRAEPENRRYAMVGKPLVDWLTREGTDWPEEALTTLRTEEPGAVERTVTSLKAELAYLDEPGAKAVNSDWKEKLLPLRALAGASDPSFLRWQQRFVGVIRVETDPPGATLVDENGINMGMTPVKFELMRGGSLSLTAFRKGHTPTSIIATVGLGDDQVVKVTLPEIPVPRAGQKYTIPGLGLDLVWIAPGTFMMGSPESEAYRAPDEGPQVKVTLPDGFWLGRCEVTQGEWVALMSSNPSHFKAVGLNGPVESVSWRDAMEFCRRLNEREKAAERLPPGYNYTLPTEAQWEYACRAGTTTAYAGDLKAMGWYVHDHEETSHAVGKKEPNAWGLYDMHGNVWEWCIDWYTDTLRVDSHGAMVVPGDGTYRVSRGGSWNCPEGNCRSALRRWLSPADRGNRLGFRLALTRIDPGRAAR